MQGTRLVSCNKAATQDVFQKTTLQTTLILIPPLVSNEMKLVIFPLAIRQRKEPLRLY